MKELSNSQAGAILGFILGILFGEIFYYFTDHLVFFVIVLFMIILGWILGSEIDIKERFNKK